MLRTQFHKMDTYHLEEGDCKRGQWAEVADSHPTGNQLPEMLWPDRQRHRSLIFTKSHRKLIAHCVKSVVRDACPQGEIRLRRDVQILVGQIIRQLVKFDILRLEFFERFDRSGL